MRHLKSVGCPLPALKDLTNRDEYLDIAHCMGQVRDLYLLFVYILWRRWYIYILSLDLLQLAGAVNRAQLRFENALCAAPNAGELAEVTEMVKAAKTDLDQARVWISELKAEVTRLGSKADAQQGEIESQKLDIQVKSRRINDLEAAPVEAAIGGDGNVVDEGVPAGAGDPIQEEKEDWELRLF